MTGAGTTRDMYLQDIPLEEALDRFFAALGAADVLQPLPGEEVPIDEALGRVTAEAIFARISVPHYHAAAMDGIAVRALETLGATESAPLRLQVGAQATWVDTGDPLPPDTNAVIMAENVQDLGDGSLEILAAVAPWQHVRQMGEDMVATELVLAENHRLDAVTSERSSPPAIPAFVCGTNRGWRFCRPGRSWSSPAGRCRPAQSSTSTQ